jgi:hypothetical protein
MSTASRPPCRSTTISSSPTAAKERDYGTSSLSALARCYNDSHCARKGARDMGFAAGFDVVDGARSRHRSAIE